MKVHRLVPLAAVIAAVVVGFSGSVGVSAQNPTSSTVDPDRYWTEAQTVTTGERDVADPDDPSTDGAGPEVVPDLADGDGRALWLGNCAVCHGPDATGTRRGPDVSASGTAAIDFQVRTGRMPLDDPDQTPRRRTPALDDHQIDALLAYTKTLVTGPEAGDPPDLDTDLRRGGAGFIERCAACHQAAGSGGALPRGTTAPPLDRSSPREIREAIRTGPGDMPRFEPAILDDRELADIVAYVRHLRDPGDRGGLGLGHLGPVTEGLVALVVGLGAVLLYTRWLGTTSETDEAAPDEPKSI